MAEDARSDLCLGIPVDHRLHSFLRPDLSTPDGDTGLGRHAVILENYGQGLRNREIDVTLPEIRFAKKLAMPETRGGVLVLLLQPGPNQQYDGRDFDRVVQECETLRAVDDVLRVVIGSSLKKTSCFDAFPFQTFPIDGGRAESSDYVEAYDVFKKMVHQKQPDVVLCCYTSPNPSIYNTLQGIGVGKTRSYRVPLGDHSCKAVNGFHPSYAVNRNKTESCLRSLYMLEMVKAFHEVNGTWKERGWMRTLRSICEVRASDLSREKKETRPPPDSERWERSFKNGLEGLETYLIFMCSDNSDELSDKGLYDYLIRNHVSERACDSLLAVTAVVDRDDRQTRSARHLAKLIRPCLLVFLSDNLKGPFNKIRKDTGIVESSAIKKLKRSLNLSNAKDGLQYTLRKGLRDLMRDLNGSYTYEGKDIYSPDWELIESAFCSFAVQLEKTLGKYLRSATVPEAEDMSLIADFSSLGIQAKNENVSMHTRKASGSWTRTAQSSPQTRATATMSLPRSQSTMSRKCYTCDKSGHFADKCPETKCYRCNRYGHRSKDCTY